MTIETWTIKNKSPMRCAASSQDSLLIILHRIQKRPAVSRMARPVKTQETAVRTLNEMTAMLVESAQPLEPVCCIEAQQSKSCKRNKTKAQILVCQRFEKAVARRNGCGNLGLSYRERLNLLDRFAVEVDYRVKVKVVGETQPQLRAGYVSAAIQVYRTSFWTIEIQPQQI